MKSVLGKLIAAIEADMRINSLPAPVLTWQEWQQVLASLRFVSDAGTRVPDCHWPECWQAGECGNICQAGVAAHFARQCEESATGVGVALHQTFSQDTPTGGGENG